MRPPVPLIYTPHTPPHTPHPLGTHPHSELIYLNHTIGATIHTSDRGTLREFISMLHRGNKHRPLLEAVLAALIAHGPGNITSTTAPLVERLPTSMESA